MIKDDDFEFVEPSVDEMLFENSKLDREFGHGLDEDYSELQLRRFLDDTSIQIPSWAWEDDESREAEFTVNEGFEGNGLMKVSTGQVINKVEFDMNKVEGKIEDLKGLIDKVHERINEISSRIYSHKNVDIEMEFDHNFELNIEPNNSQAHNSIQQKLNESMSLSNSHNLDNNEIRYGVDFRRRLVDEDGDLKIKENAVDPASNSNSKSDFFNASIFSNVSCDVFSCVIPKAYEKPPKGRFKEMTSPESGVICDDVVEEELLRFYYANCRGFSSKKESIVEITSRLNSDVIILTETNFKGTCHPRIHGSISRALRRYTREYAVAPPDNTEQGTVFTSLTIKNTR